MRQNNKCFQLITFCKSSQNTSSHASCVSTTISTWGLKYKNSKHRIGFNRTFSSQQNWRPGLTTLKEISKRFSSENKNIYIYILFFFLICKYGQFNFKQNYHARKRMKFWRGCGKTLQDRQHYLIAQEVCSEQPVAPSSHLPS